MKLKSTNRRISRNRSFVKRPRRMGRDGTATVELAVCLPIIMIISLGAMESSSMIFLRQALVQSSYETCREVVKNDGDISVARLRGEQVLSFRGITGQTITFEPADPQSQPRGTEIVVTVSAPGDSNSILPFGPFSGSEIAVSTTMVKE